MEKGGDSQMVLKGQEQTSLLHLPVAPSKTRQSWPALGTVGSPVAKLCWLDKIVPSWAKPKS